MMRILITGATGFIGSELFQQLTDEGKHEVYGLQRYNSHRIESPNMLFGDVTEGEVSRVFEIVSPHIVLHLAAVASNEQANLYPAECMRVNAEGTARVVAECQIYDVGMLVLASSSEVYGFEKGNIDSRTTIAAKNPYAASKIAAEQAVMASGLPYVIMHAFNTFGRGKMGLPKFVIDEAIYQALTTGHIHLRDPNPVRDLIFRQDHVNAYLRVLRMFERADPTGMSYTFPSGQAMSIGAMAELVAEMTGCPAPTFGNKQRSGDIEVLSGDPDQAQRALGWVPMLVEEGLQLAIEEWREYLNTTRATGRTTQAVG